MMVKLELTCPNVISWEMPAVLVLPTLPKNAPLFLSGSLVMILITPDDALGPKNMVCGPRITSIRSTSVADNPEKI